MISLANFSFFMNSFFQLLLRIRILAIIIASLYQHSHGLNNVIVHVIESISSRATVQGCLD